MHINYITKKPLIIATSILGLVLSLFFLYMSVIMLSTNTNDAATISSAVFTLLGAVALAVLFVMGLVKIEKKDYLFALTCLISGAIVYPALGLVNSIVSFSTNKVNLQNGLLWLSTVGAIAAITCLILALVFKAKGKLVARILFISGASIVLALSVLEFLSATIAGTGNLVIMILLLGAEIGFSVTEVIAAVKMGNEDDLDLYDDDDFCDCEDDCCCCDCEDDMVDRLYDLEKLNDLHEKKALTDEEFEALKKEILAR